MAKSVGAGRRASMATLHAALADTMAARGYFRTPRVEAAFRAVPRHLFVPDAPLEQVYSDEVIITKVIDGQGVSSSSQPAIMVIMLEQLDLQPGQRVLEVGAGTGYNAALLAHIVGEAGQVVTLDIDQDIVDAARAHLAAAGFDRVQVVCTDGGLGWPDAAPYDRIILTIGAWDITPAWRAQLAPAGRLVLPLTLGEAGSPQVSVAFVPTGDNGLTSVDVTPCGFMPLRGAFAQPTAPQWLALGDEPGLVLVGEDVRGLDAAVVLALLNGGGRDLPTGVQLTLHEVHTSLTLWLALWWQRLLAEQPAFRLCSVVARAGWVARDIIPNALSIQPDVLATAGLADATSLCLLRFAPEDILPFEEPAEIVVRQYGPDGELARRLVEQIQQWDWAGRPAAKDVHLRVYPLDAPVPLAAGETRIRKRWHQHLLSWLPAATL